MLSFLGIDYTSHLVNGAEREQKSPAFLVMNPFGQVPLLKDGNTIIRDSQAILVYLARAYGADNWFPVDAVKAAEVTAWLSTAANEIARGPNALRLHYKFGRVINLDEATAMTQQVLNALEKHLENREWLVAEHITIADVAVYPYIALAHEGKVDLSPFVSLNKWLRRIELLPGFVTMPGIPFNSR